MLKAVVGSMALAWALGGCAHQEPPATGPGDMPVPTVDAGDAAAVSLAVSPRPVPGAAGDIATSTASNGLPLADTDTANDVPSSAAIDLTDAQILEVAQVVNRGEVEQSELALAKGSDAQVKKLAAALVREQAASDSEATALAGAVGLLPAASATSMSLEGQSKDIVTALREQQGADFDRAYLKAQIEEQKSALDILAQKLLANAKNANLKAYLTDLQAKVAAALQESKTLRTEIELKSASARDARRR